MNMSKLKKLMKTRARGDFEYNRNDNEYQDKSMSMKTVMKKRRRKTEEDKKENLINMSKMKKLMKTIERADFEYNRNDDEYQDNTHEYEDSDEEEEKEDRRREKGEID